MLKYYYKFENEKKYIYSLDMVRYNIELKNNKETLLNFQSLLQHYNMHNDCEIKQQILNKTVGYKYFYSVRFFTQDDECSFCLGFQLNCKSDNLYKGFIEYNPNKCMCFTQFQFFLDAIFELCCSVDCVRYDCAIDIPIERKYVKMARTGNANYQFIVDSKTDGVVLDRSVTEYRGTRNKNRFTKLYDKTKESHLDYPLTRLEFTFEHKEKTFQNLPQIFIYDTITTPDIKLYQLKDNDIVLIDLLRNCEPIDFNFYFKRLSYHMRKKIEPYLADKTLQLDIDLLNKIRDLAHSLEF